VLGWLWGLLSSRSQPQPEDVNQLSDTVVQRMSEFQQGDLLPGITEIVVQTSNGPTVVKTAGVVIVSQTCEIVRDQRLFVHVAPREQQAGTTSSLARKGRMPRYVHLPRLGDNDFVVLDRLYSIHKSVVANAERIPTVQGAREAAIFGQAVGRYFSRFAYPDEVAEYLDPLAKHIMEKALRPNSAEGKLIGEVVQLRLRSVNGWENPPYDLNLLVIVNSTALPMFPGDELPPFDEPLNAWLYDAEGTVQRTSNEIASKLKNEQDAGKRYALWQALGDAWVARCGLHPAGIAGMTASVISADEFTFTMLDLSELLDLDHLSAPTSDRGGAG
jgi:hypothetical protein